MNIAAPAAAGMTPMYCSTCGSRIADGRATCQVCGAVAARAPFPAPIPAAAAVGPMYAAAQVQVCPRCGYRGIGSSYFSKGTHVALLVGSALAFFPAAAGYVVLRHNHRVCPACGLGWGAHGTRALTLLPGTNGAMRTSDVVLPAAEVGGGAKRGWAIALLIFGAILLAAGFADFEMGAIVMGMFAAGGGGLLLKKAKSDREERRDAILQSLQLPVLQLAGRKGGRLTVTDVATELGWPMVRAEKVLNSLDDGMRVMSDITDDGVIVYDFLEIRTAGLSASQKPELRLHA